MSLFEHRSPTALIVVVGFLVVGLLAPLCITKRQKLARRFACDECGTTLWVTTDTLAGASESGKAQRLVQATELSNWFGSHISTNCVHHWVQIHTSARIYFALGGRRLYDVSGGSGGQVTPHLTYLFPDDRTQLENLLKESPTKCRNFIHEKLQLEISGKDD